MASKPLTDRINRHAQAMARHFLAYPSTLEDIASLIRTSMKARPEDDAEIITYLRKPATRMLLANHWECGLWPASDGKWRLVSTALPDTPEAARRRLTHRPAGSDQCWFCLIAEKGFGELVPIFDVAGREIPAVRVHRGGCARAYHRLRALAEKTDAPTKPDAPKAKESIL